VDEDEKIDQQVFTVICQYQSFDALTEEKVTLQDEIDENLRLETEEANAEVEENKEVQTDN